MSGTPYHISSTHDQTVKTIAFVTNSELDVSSGIFTVLQGTGIGGNAGTVIADGGGRDPSDPGSGATATTFRIGDFVNPAAGVATWVNADTQGRGGLLEADNGGFIELTNVNIIDDPTNPPPSFTYGRI